MKYCKVECIIAEDFRPEQKEPEKEPEVIFVPEDYREVRSGIFAKLINTERNQELLREIPHQSVLDLSLVYYMFRNHDPDDENILITKEMVRAWKTEPSELFQDALSNTRNLLGCCIRPLREMIGEMLQNIGTDIPPEPEEGRLPMYVLTNLWKRNGAVCMLFDDILEEFSGKQGNDIYVIPSSVHEVILVPAKDGLTRQELNRIICEVNRTELMPEEILADHTYVYSAKAGKIVL